MVLTCSLSTPDSIRQKLSSLDYRWRSGPGRLLSSVLPNIYDSARVSSWGHVPAVCSIPGSHATLSFLNTGNMYRNGKFKHDGKSWLIDGGRKHQFYHSFVSTASLLFTDELVPLSVSVTTHLHLLSWGVGLPWAERREIFSQPMHTPPEWATCQKSSTEKWYTTYCQGPLGVPKNAFGQIWELNF